MLNTLHNGSGSIKKLILNVSNIIHEVSNDLQCCRTMHKVSTILITECNAKTFFLPLWIHNYSFSLNKEIEINAYDNKYMLMIMNTCILILNYF